MIHNYLKFKICSLSLSIQPILSALFHHKETTRKQKKETYVHTCTPNFYSSKSPVPPFLSLPSLLPSPPHSTHFPSPFAFSLGSRDGAVVIALAFHQCGPGSKPRPGVISGLSLLLILVLAPRVFLRVLPFSSLGNSRATGLSVVRLLCVTLVKTKSIYLFFIFSLVPQPFPVTHVSSSVLISSTICSSIPKLIVCSGALHFMR